MYGFIMDNLNYEPKMIVRHIEQTYQYTMVDTGMVEAA